MQSIKDNKTTDERIDYKLSDANIRYFPNFFTREKSDALLDRLIDTIPWKQNTIKMYGKENLVPRLESWHGNDGKSYGYSGIRMNPMPWTPELLFIKGRIEENSETQFNSVLINYYRGGKDRVAWHSDDEKELGRNPVIGSISLGAERKFRLRHKEYKNNGLKKEILLCHGSLLLMSGPTQHFWMHEIPRTTKPIGARVNLTFRFIH